MTPFLIYLAAINLAAFCAMALDKYRAIHHRWRIPEATLMGIALVGGSIGAMLGMYLLRHKTRHPKFSIGLPAIFLMEYGCLALWYLFLR